MVKNAAPKESTGRRSSRHSDPAPVNGAPPAGNRAASTPASGAPRRTGRHVSTPVPDPPAVDKKLIQSGAKTAPARTRRPSSTPAGGAASSSKTPAAAATTGGQKRSRLARSAGPSNTSASRSLRRRGSVSFKETSEDGDDGRSSSDEEEQQPEIIDDTIYEVPADALLPETVVLEIKKPVPPAEGGVEGGAEGADEVKEGEEEAPAVAYEIIEVVVPTAAMGELTAAYALLRSFSWQLRLSPFTFEDFCAAMTAPHPTALMDEVHVCVLRALAFDEVKEEREERKLDLGLLDHLTWPCYVWEMLRLTVDPLAKYEWSQRLLESMVPTVYPISNPAPAGEAPEPAMKTPATAVAVNATTPAAGTTPADGVDVAMASEEPVTDGIAAQQGTGIVASGEGKIVSDGQNEAQPMEIDGVPDDAAANTGAVTALAAQEGLVAEGAVTLPAPASEQPTAAPVVPASLPPPSTQPTPRPRAFEPVDISQMDQQLAAANTNLTAVAPTEHTASEIFTGCAPAVHHQQVEYYSLPVEVKATILSRLCDHLLDCTTFRAEIDRREEEGLYIAGHGDDGGSFGMLSQEERERAAALAKKKEEDTINADTCVICGVGGRLFCCDNCPAAYHCRCLGERSKYKKKKNKGKSKAKTKEEEDVEEAEEDEEEEEEEKEKEEEDNEPWFCPECVLGGRGETAGLRIPVAAQNKWKQPLHIINGAVVRTQLPPVQSSGRHVKELTTIVPVAVFTETAAEEALEKSKKVKNVDEVPLLSSFKGVKDPPHLKAPKNPPPKPTSTNPANPPPPPPEILPVGPEAYNNKYRNAWTAASIALRSTIEEVKKRKTKAKLTIPTGTCGRLTVPELPEPMPLSRFGWVQMQGRAGGAGGRLTTRCGKCHTCLRPTLRKGCMNPSTKGPAEDVVNLNPLQPPQPDTSKLSYLIAFVCKVEREFWALIEGPWATEPGGGMQFRARWAVNVRNASSASDLAQSLLELESVLRPVAFDRSWFGGSSTTAGGTASHPGSRVISRTGSMMDVQGGAGPSSQQAAGDDGDDGPGSNKQKSTDPYDIRFEKIVKGGWEMDRRSHAAHVASINRLPHTLLKKAARHCGRRPIPGVLYKKQEWKLESPRLAWIAEMEAVQTCAQLALAIRKLDAVLNWEGVMKPKGLASDAPFASATIHGKRPVASIYGSSASSASEYEYLIDMKQISAADAALLHQQQQHLNALFQQRLAMSQAQALMAAQAQAQQQGQQQIPLAHPSGPLAGLTSAFLPIPGSGAPNAAAPGRLGSLNTWPAATVPGGGGGLGAPVLQGILVPLGTAALPPLPPLPPRPPLPTPPKQEEVDAAIAEAAAAAAMALAAEQQLAALTGQILPPGFPSFVGGPLGAFSAMPSMHISMAPAPMVAVAPTPAAENMENATTAPAVPAAVEKRELTEDEKLTREIVQNAIKKAIEAEEEERLLQMPAAMAAKLRRMQSSGGGGGNSSADLNKTESNANEDTKPALAPPSSVPAAAAPTAGVPPGLMPLFGGGMFGRPPVLAPPPPTWTHERDIPLWFIRSYEELCRREAANVAARELQAAARRGSQMDSAIKEAARQAAQVAAQAAADACGICSAAQGDNPELDALWICCDTCNRWFHGGCVAMSQEDVNTIAEDEQWDCPGCLNARRKAERAARREGKTLPSNFSPLDAEIGKKQGGRASKPFYEYADYKAGEAKMLEKLKRGEPLDGIGSRGKKRSAGGGYTANNAGGYLTAETEAEAAARQAAKAEQKKRKREEEARLAAEPIYCPVCQYPDFGRPLVECDACHRWFHYECVGTAIEEIAVAIKEEKSLHCAECQGKRVRPPTQAAIDAAILAAADGKGPGHVRKKMREDSAQPSPMTDGDGTSAMARLPPQPIQQGPRGGAGFNWREPVNKIIVRTMRLTVAGPFSRPVSLEDVPDYTEIVARPMDLDTLHSAIPRLNSPLDVLAGVNLIVDNCILYNGEGSDFAAAAVEMQRSFLKLWAAKGMPLMNEQWEAMQAGESFKSASAGNTGDFAGDAGTSRAAGLSNKKNPGAGGRSATKKDTSFITSLTALSPAPGASPAADWPARASKALDRLAQHPAAELFLEPVSREIEEYYDVIRKPMDIGTIQNRLAQGSYIDPSEVAADVVQIWRNCKIFNEPKAEIVKDANEAEKAFIEYWIASGVYQGGDRAFQDAATHGDFGGSGVQNRRETASAFRPLPPQLPQPPPAPPVSNVRNAEWQEAARKVLHRMITFVGHSTWFIDPVSDEIAPDYRDVISTPMDLTTVLEKVKAGKYASPDDVVADMELIWNNAALYNGLEHPVAKAAAKAKESFEKLWTAAGLDSFDPGYQQYQQHPNYARQQLGSGSGSGANTGGTGSRPPSAPSVVAIHSNDWVSIVRRVLSGVMNLPVCIPFNGPISDSIEPGYSQVVTQHMDFGTILKNLGRGRYSDPVQVLNDVKLIFSNWKRYANATGDRDQTYQISGQQVFDGLMHSWRQEGLPM